MPTTQTDTAQQTLLNFAVSHSPAIFYVVGLEEEQRFRFISSNVETITGHPADAFMTNRQYGRQFIHPDDYPTYAKKIEQLTSDGKLTHEYRFRSLDGDYRWYRDELRIADTGLEFIGCMIDITAEVEATEQLREGERHFRKLVESNPLPVWLTDIETSEIYYASPAAAAALGYEWPSEERHFFIGHYVDPKARQFAVDTLKRDGQLLDFETRLRRADGSEFWVAINSRLIDYQGRDVTITGIVDLSEHKRREAELRHIQEELRESEQHFRMLVENHPLPVALVDVESGKTLYNSPAAAELTGRSWDPGNEQYAQDQYANAKDREIFIAKLREHGELLNYPTQSKRSDGSTFWVSTSARLIEWQGRELHIASMVDLTEQLDREEALQRAHETLEDAIESLSAGFALYDADDRLITCNSRYQEFNQLCSDILKPGLKFEDLVRTGAERGKYPGDSEEVEAWLKAHKDNRYASYGGGFEFRQSDGRWVSYSNQRTRQGGMVVTLSDITERKKMERALRDSEEAVRTILESSPVPLTMVHAENGHIIYESPVAQTIFRYDAAVGYGDAIHPRWLERNDRDAFLERLRSNGSIDGMDVVLRRGDDTTFPAALSSRLIDYKGDEVIISSIFDLTERFAMEKELVRQREALHQSEKMVALGGLLASVAHELNNPLSVVVGQSMLLQETTDDPAIATRAERIGTAADRCARVVKAFLAMARQQPLESRPVDLNDMIESSIEVTGYALRSSGVDVSIRLARDLPAVNVDPDQFTQVFTNLLVNAEHALRSAPGQRRVWISSRYREKTNDVVVKIKDNGPGVPDDVRRRIFEPFFTTKDVGKGTGMGLAICHRILDSHGGKIKIESTPGGGATFVLQLPAMNGVEENCVEATPVEQGPKGLSILIVDDEPGVADMLTDILNGDGHRTDTAANGRDALALLETEEFDIVLSDMRMPTMDGPALFSYLQAQRPDLLERVAFITGDTLSGDVKDFLAVVGRPHIEKPITPQDVRDLVRRVAMTENGGSQ
jgi:PAS domain S-box-containing protein